MEAFIVIGFIVGITVIVLIISAIATKINHTHIDHKNAKIKESGGNKQKLSDRFSDKD